ncbi:tryptophan halogenase family protein [Teredinibacter sp. KSP-S5-2]|uniref:tryptophan halogenase family protein n=1 Tax=Teredinibacter sp. KSP-S5-2 TaxID=3034506 RepID=UPI002934314E|nr:tryptophan halogenase family protein [Teredinibacter sp. KSP-S5-2]WNO07696.1 tryptophan 7-halogenase [Teredinibacter sp. KSP-S5-2]
MSLTQDPISRIVIVGGGTSGWMAATMLSSILKKTNTQIDLVESSEIGTIGVGEATVPPFLVFLQSVGIDEKDFIQKTSSTFKLGIKFDNWLNKGHSYFHPFGQIGRNIDGHDFFHLWLKNNRTGNSSSLMDHSAAAVMAKQNKFMPTVKLQGTPLEQSLYALHIDAGLAAKYLRDVSEKNGVRRVDAKVDKVHLADNGYIKELELDNGDRMSGELFIDCTGFRGLLIEQAMKTGYEDWSHYLPCDRAVTVQTSYDDEPPVYTNSIAQDAGWTWHIPLQHRMGNGYVYASRFMSDDQARDTLMNSISGDCINEPRCIPFLTGKRKKIWNKNCLALGLASGFLEPLESTAIHLVFKTLSYFIRYFPDKDFDTALQNEFEHKISQEYLKIRDFIILHYALTQREDTEFWRWCKTMSLPDSLKERVDKYCSNGIVVSKEEDFFRAPSWYSVYTGMGVLPKKYNPLVNALDDEALAKSIASGQAAIKNTVGQLPAHGEFVRKMCPAIK